uniref:Uncharacterized protein n=1 Tax=Amphilophus citrinellus TaxID=61819 RepID=A0A3Q0S7C1_AMPCI
MSVNASKHELIQLIYRHLKEHGYHSAADELQNHSPQVNTAHAHTHTHTHTHTHAATVIVTMFHMLFNSQFLNPDADIAKMNAINALDSSAPPKKRVRKPRAKAPAKTGTPVKQSDGMVKNAEEGGQKHDVTETPTKKSSPKKNVTKTATPVTTSGTQTTVRSLSTPEEKPDTSILFPTEQPQMKEDRETATPSKQTTDERTPEPKKKKKKKKEREKDEDKGEKNELGEDGKEKHGEEKKKAKVTGREDEKKPVKENKKAKGTESDAERTKEDTIETNTSGYADDKNLSESTVQEKKHKKKKREKTGSEGSLEQMGNSEQEVKENKEKKQEENNQNSEHIAEGTKAKKKKKRKTDSEETSLHAAEERKVIKKKLIFESESISEQITEEIENNAEQKAEENEETSEHTAEKKKAKKRKRESLNGEENPEQVLKEKKSKKKSENVEERKQLFEDAVDNKMEETPAWISSVKKKKKNKPADTEPLPPPDLQATSPPTEKKKSE